MTTKPRVQPEDLWPDEWVEWFHLSPAERWRESEKLWGTFLILGGSLDPEPDTQSPFFDAAEWCALSDGKRQDVKITRRGGI